MSASYAIRAAAWDESIDRSLTMSAARLPYLPAALMHFTKIERIAASPG